MSLRAANVPEAATMAPTGGTLRFREMRAGLFALDDRTALYAAVLGAAIVIALAVPLAAALNVWIDEAFALHSTGAGVAYAWREAIEFEAQPPLYFVLEAVWRRLNEESIAFARFPSAVFAAAGVALIVGAAHRFTPRFPPLIVALITAFNPIVIWAAAELRVYALVFFVGSALTWAFFSGYVVADRSRRAQAVYVAVAIIGLYTQYYTGFFLLAQAITLLVMRRRAVRAFAFSITVVTLAFAPFAGIVMQHIRGSGKFVQRASLMKVTHEIADSVFIYILPHDLSWSGALKYISIAVTTLLFALIVSARPAIRDIDSRAIVLQWMLSVVLFAVMFEVAGLPFALRRHLIVIAPSSMLVGLILVASLTRRALLGRAIALATVAASTATTLVVQYRPPLEKTGDWQRVAAILASSSTTPIAVFPAEFALPLGVYLALPIIPIPRPVPFRYNYVSATALTGEPDVARSLDRVRARYARLWLVTADVCENAGATSFNYHCRYLQDYLNHRYRLVKTVIFNGASARLYIRTRNAPVDLSLRTAPKAGHVRARAQMPAYHS